MEVRAPHEQRARFAMTVYALSYPPSVNHYWRSLGRGRVVISFEGRKYREAVAERLAGCQKATGRLTVVIAATMPDRRVRDVDNLPKSVLDALKHAGAYEDDSQIDDLRIYRAGVAKPGALLVTVTEAEPAPPRFALDNCS